MSQFNLIEHTQRLLKLLDDKNTEIGRLTKENAQLKQALAFEQRQNQRHANKQH